MLLKVQKLPKSEKGSVYEEILYMTTKQLKYEMREVSLPKDIDREWLQAACNYVHSLSLHDRLVLFGYTSPCFGNINLHRAGRDVAEDLVLEQKRDPYSLVYEFIDNKDAAKWFAGDPHPLLKKQREIVRLQSKATDKPTNIDTQIDRALHEFDEMARATITIKPAFHEKVIEYDSKASCGIVLYPQYCTLYGRVSFTEFVSRIPHITSSMWRRLLDTYVRDLDAIFEGIPPTTRVVTVFRGSGGKRVRSMPTYTSTSMSRTVARKFANPSLHQMQFPAGSKLLPVLCVSRYPDELELLAQPETKYSVVRRRG
jgi:hypothetical protein